MIAISSLKTNINIIRMDVFFNLDRWIHTFRKTLSSGVHTEPIQYISIIQNKIIDIVPITLGSFQNPAYSLLHHPQATLASSLYLFFLYLISTLISSESCLLGLSWCCEWIHHIFWSWKTLILRIVPRQICITCSRHWPLHDTTWPIFSPPQEISIFLVAALILQSQTLENNLNDSFLFLMLTLEQWS